MGESRSTYGPALSLLGAILLAVAVFLPWYGVSFTAHSVAIAQQAGEQFATQYGNAALQSHLGALQSSLGGIAGHEVFALSAHQALGTLNVVLLILAGLGILIALLALAGPAAAASEANRGPLVLLGFAAAACVVFRMLDKPAPAAGELLSLSLREGAWLALIGALCMGAGALLPRREPATSVPKPEAANVWSELSGWTPET
ncbi:MAG TPA: hypothetical protein VGF47_04870 [Solirubrobacteraceae bacterium]